MEKGLHALNILYGIFDSVFLMRTILWFLKQIQDISGRMTMFKVYNVGIDRVTFQTADPNLACVRICYRKNDDKICDER